MVVVFQNILSYMTKIKININRVRTGEIPRPRGKSLEVIGAVGRKQTVPRVGATRLVNTRVRERWRTDNRR